MCIIEQITKEFKEMMVTRYVFCTRGGCVRNVDDKDLKGAITQYLKSIISNETVIDLFIKFLRCFEDNDKALVYFANRMIQNYSKDENIIDRVTTITHFV